MCVAVGMTGCGGGPTTVNDGKPPKFSEFCPAPKSKDDGWLTGLPGDFGLRAANIENLLRDARQGRLGKLHSVLVVRDGVLVIEEYFRGARREHCQLIASVTKSLVSILVGMSLERRPERTVDTPLVELFPQYADELAPEGKSAITLAHALTMTAGLDWDEYTYPHPDKRNPNTQMYRQAEAVDEGQDGEEQRLGGGKHENRPQAAVPLAQIADAEKAADTGAGQHQRHDFRTPRRWVADVADVRDHVRQRQGHGHAAADRCDREGHLHLQG
jgi:hypothetical protein